MDIIVALSRGDLERVRAVVEQDAALVHALNNNTGATPLLCAANHGRVDVARYLLDHGATVNHGDRFKDTDKIAMLSPVCFEHGGSYVDAAHYGGWTACHCACSRGHSNVLRQLLEAGADPTLRDGQGRTAMGLAAHYGHHDCVSTLQRVRRVCDASSTPVLRRSKRARRWST